MFNMFVAGLLAMSAVIMVIEREAGLAALAAVVACINIALALA